jgi:threonine/homoserine/homoserine lactone efflux protein
MENPILFTLAVLAVLTTPGPTNTLLATAGAADGLRRVFLLIPAEGAGYCIGILTLRLLLGPLVATAPDVVIALRLLVGAYLLWVSWRLWTRGADQVGGRKVITARQVFVTTLLNPKVIVLGLGIIPFGVAGAWFYLAAFQVMAAVIGSLWIGGGAMLGRLAANRGRVRLVPRMGAVVLCAFAVTLVASPLLH